jgi:hypothetical protein
MVPRLFSCGFVPHNYISIAVPLSAVFLDTDIQDLSISSKFIQDLLVSRIGTEVTQIDLNTVTRILLSLVVI